MRLWLLDSSHRSQLGGWIFGVGTVLYALCLGSLTQAFINIGRTCAARHHTWACHRHRIAVGSMIAKRLVQRLQMHTFELLIDVVLVAGAAGMIFALK